MTLFDQTRIQATPDSVRDLPYTDDRQPYPCCGAMTYGEHRDNVSEGACSAAKLRAELDKAGAA